MVVLCCGPKRSRCCCSWLQNYIVALPALWLLSTALMARREFGVGGKVKQRRRRRRYVMVVMEYGGRVRIPENGIGNGEKCEERWNFASTMWLFMPISKETSTICCFKHFYFLDFFRIRRTSTIADSLAHCLTSSENYDSSRNIRSSEGVILKVIDVSLLGKSF